MSLWFALFLLSNTLLPKQNCLKRKKDFERVFKKGKGFKEGFLFLKFVPNNLDKIRCGIIVSQKVSKKAVIRNKIKRRIRAIISRKLLKISSLIERKKIDLIIVVLPGLETKNFWEIEKTIDKLLEKSKIKYQKSK